MEIGGVLARRNLGLGGQEAIDWVRKLIPGAVETARQEELIRVYQVKKKPRIRAQQDNYSARV